MVVNHNLLIINSSPLAVENLYRKFHELEKLC